MSVRKRADYPEGRYTLVFLVYGAGHAEIELTHNWGDHPYVHGTAFGHLAIAVENVEEATRVFQSRGAKIVRPAGPRVDEVGETIAFLEDPDQYHIELVQLQVERFL